MPQHTYGSQTATAGDRSYFIMRVLGIELKLFLNSGLTARAFTYWFISPAPVVT